MAISLIGEIPICDEFFVARQEKNFKKDRQICLDTYFPHPYIWGVGRI